MVFQVELFATNLAIGDSKKGVFEKKASFLQWLTALIVFRTLSDFWAHFLCGQKHLQDFFKIYLFKNIFADQPWLSNESLITHKRLCFPHVKYFWRRIKNRNVKVTFYVYHMKHTLWNRKRQKSFYFFIKLFLPKTDFLLYWLLFSQKSCTLGQMFVSDVSDF